MLTFTVDKQILKRTDTDKAIADSVKYLTATFTFSEDWTGTTKTVLFNYGTVTYAITLESDTCVVPWEVIHSDYFRISVYGVKDDERITTNNVTVYVGESGYTEGGEPQPPTPSQIEQILQILSNLTGGAANKVLAKKSSQDYDFKWVNNEGGGGGGSSVEWEQILESGTKIATITIDDEPFDVYAPTPPVKTSELINDSNYQTASDVSTALAPYQTKNLTESVEGATTVEGALGALSTNKADASDIPDSLSDLSSDATHRTVTDTEISSWNGKSVVVCTQELSTGTLIATITVNGTPVNLYAPAGGGGDTVAWSQVLLSGTKIGTITINGTSTDVYAPTPFNGDYEDLTNKPTIPTKTSDLINDSGFLTQHQNIKTLNGETLVGTGDVSTHQSETVTVSGDTTSKQLTSHKLCYFDGTLIALTITFPQAVNVGDEFNFIFKTSANGCTLSVPSSVKWDGGTAPTLEANTIYEVSIDGLGIALISQGVSTV